MKQRIISAVLCLVLAAGLLCAPLLPASAVTPEELDSAELIGDREPMYSSLCLVYSCWYMARRRVAIERDMETALATDFTSYRTAATKSAGGVIVYFNYTWQPTEDLALDFGHISTSYTPNSYDISDLAHEDDYVMEITRGINISSGVAGSTDPDKLLLILRHLLLSHPEGIAILCKSSMSSSHAALITGYDEESGLLLCADPVYGGPSVPLTGKNYLFNSPPTNYAQTQSGILRYVESLWWITNGDPAKTAAFVSTPAPSPTPTPSPEPSEAPQPEDEEPGPEENEPESAPVDVHLPLRRSYSAGQFLDVREDDWFCADVQRVYELGLMNGVGDGAFDPFGHVTLAQAVAMAARIHSLYYWGSDDFDQSRGEHWYDCYVEYALMHELLPEDLALADLDRDATRLEFARLLAASLPTEALSERNALADGAIPDVKVTDAWAETVYLLYRAGILTGDADGAFRPASSITRAEASAVVSRMAESDMRRSLSFT